MKTSHKHLMNISSRIFLMSIILIACNPANKDTGSPDYPHREYGGAIWMTENMAVTNDKDGHPLHFVYPDNDASNKSTYGLLYDYKNACNVCPPGWHLPAAVEWDKLIRSIGADSANTMKDVQYWNLKDPRFSNNSGFSVRPAGYGGDEGWVNLFGIVAVFWSATKVDTHFVRGYALPDTATVMYSAPQHSNYAFSVRCVKDK